MNLGNLVSNQECLPSCTPGAAMRLLEYYNFDLSGKDVLVIGRSVNVGKPLSLMLLSKNATVTISHSKTVGLKVQAYCKHLTCVLNKVSGCTCTECFLLRSLPVNSLLLLTRQGVHFTNHTNLPFLLRI